jgi:hypothetical protein
MPHSDGDGIYLAAPLVVSRVTACGKSVCRMSLGLRLQRRQ